MARDYEEARRKKKGLDQKLIDGLQRFGDPRGGQTINPETFRRLSWYGFLISIPVLVILLMLNGSVVPVYIAFAVPFIGWCRLAYAVTTMKNTATGGPRLLSDMLFGILALLVGLGIAGQTLGVVVLMGAISMIVGLSMVAIGYVQENMGLLFLGTTFAAVPVIAFFYIAGLPLGLMAVVFGAVAAFSGAATRHLDPDNLFYKMLTVVVTLVWLASMINVFSSALALELFNLGFAAMVLTLLFTSIYMVEHENYAHASHIYGQIIKEILKGAEHGGYLNEKLGIGAFMSVWMEIGITFSIIGSIWYVLAPGFLPGINATMVFFAALFLGPASLYYLFRHIDEVGGYARQYGGHVRDQFRGGYQEGYERAERGEGGRGYEAGRRSRQAQETARDYGKRGGSWVKEKGKQARERMRSDEE